MNSIIFFVFFLFHHFISVVAEQGVNNSLNRLLDLNLFEDAINPEICDQQMEYILTDNSFLRNRFLDAGIRFPRGFFAANTVDFGNYYQCLSINQETKSNTIQGKYCTITVFSRQNIQSSEVRKLPWTDFDLVPIRNKDTFDLIKTYEKLKNAARLFVGAGTHERGTRENYAELFTLAVCIPKPCTTQQAFEKALPIDLSALGFIHRENFCRLPNDKQWLAVDYIAISVFSIIGLLTVLSTVYDIYKSEVQRKVSKELFCTFSVYKNTRRLTTFISDSNSLDCVDGIRALSMMWIILAHSFVVSTSTLPMANFIDTYEWATSFTSLWITSGAIAVDTFFLLSGILVVYTTANKVSSIKLAKNIHLFYLNRILRMFPLLAAIILLEVSVFKHVLDGPYMTSISWRSRNCRNYWWSTLLYAQNYINPLGMCLGHSWYLDVDMQLHIIVPLVLFWVLYGKRAAWSSLTVALGVSLTAATTYNFIMNFPGGSFVPSRFEDSLIYTQKYYYNTLTRAPPFFVGLIFGYLIHSSRGKQIKIPMILLCILWVAAVILPAWVISYNYFIMQVDWDNQLVDNLMNSFMRPIWAASIGCIIFACTQGYGGPVNWFLSLNIWKLPARISYAMYLFHYPLMFIIASSALQPYFFTVPFLVYQFLAEYSISFVVAFIATVLIDGPFSKIFKIILNGGIGRRNEHK